MKLRKVKSLRGTLTVPADKSISHRSIMFGAISQGITTIKNFLRADDCMSTLHAFEALGVPITVDKDNISITGVGVNGLKAVAEGIIDVGNSGTTIRLLSGILAATNFTTVLTGDASLKKRPMDRIASPLEQMQVQVTGQKEQVLPPIEVVGNPELKPITYVMPVASAQVKSAILFAALAAKGKTTIIEKEISRNHTEEMIQQFGGKIQRQDKMIQLTGPQQLTARQVIVPGDISSAAFFLAAGALVPNSKIILKNVGINSTRTGIIDVLKAMGASLTITEVDHKNQSATLTIESSNLKAVTVSGDLIPRLIDEIPIIALLATQAAGITVIKNAEELKVKETNRIDATAEELQKMNARIETTEDGMIIYGKTTLHGAKVSSRKDHRIGMMLQIAALICQEETILENAEAISISYPNFFTDLDHLTKGES